MKYIKQFGIIIIISFIGEILNKVIPLPIPTSIYGIIILFLCLQFKIIKLEQIKDVSSFLIDILPILFVPPAVGLLSSWEHVKNDWLSYLFISVISTFVVMLVAGKVTQAIIKSKKDKEANTNE